MTAEGRIQSAARWIRGAYGLMASAVGKTDVGYDKSRWQRIGDATRAVEYAVKGLVLAVVRTTRAWWIPALLLAGCGGAEEAPDVIVVDTPGAVSIKAEVWADNWFAFYLGERLIVEDSTPITTERSFNAEAFVFNADYPLQLNFVAKDFKQDDTGLEYIGRSNQQMGDGGLIAQFTDLATGTTVAVTNAGWRCLLIHDAPLDRACEDESEPVPGVGPCRFAATPVPDGWRRPGFDDAHWPSAVEHSEADVRPRGGYDSIEWRDGARLIWTADLETHNTLLCRLTVEQP